MKEEQNILLQEYAKNPLCNFVMDSPTLSFHEGNFICGDDIIVYLQIQDSIITDYSYSGNCSTVTTAAASFLSEFIIGATIHDVLNRDYDTIASRGLEVSPRRKRAAVIAILAARNGIHTYLSDGKLDSFDDLIN